MIFLILATICAFIILILFSTLNTEKNTKIGNYTITNYKRTKKQEQCNKYIQENKNLIKQDKQTDLYEIYKQIKIENITKQKMISKRKKGTEYELYIAKYFRNEGYKIYMNGLNNGKKDDGIDVICHKDKETILIQCKNWKYPIEQKDIRAFIGDCHVYINKNAAFLRNRKIRKIFITSNEETKKAVELYVKENQAEVEYITIPMFD
ncbi:restriction endonuclease [Campylobacter gracilis]|uniref:Restriction endonuclease n=1 Tax=Campylobacter gracilis RM3268 TaxID=553220 RepID=C8PE97_9BACT|nr:restriction endonuclease [Campylobacter gracilis]AKT92822.1 putative restriction endonuclease [Campylobacter gracilis]EEV18970.1 restriction endonuclease [Campylobacter gracilis RM3268]UEB45008.1 restriction endonuclease [Campylobacter gracilis]SUW78856.1 Restriction endonuclease [Campylobacter gracilis]